MKLKVMVLGQGGREHALVKALSRTAHVFAWPGSDGMSLEAKCLGGSLSDHQGIIAFAKKESIDLVVVGPDQALADGVVDALEAENILTFGPIKSSARLEWSKVFSKEFMKQAGLPTARADVVASVSEVEKHFSKYDPPYVLKADGLALGKGVFICKNKEELMAAAQDIFVHKTLGSAGERALLEEFTAGWELSLHILTNGHDYTLFPGAQDHKRLSDNDQGPNTGGMGAVAPVPISSSLLEQIKRQVLDPIIKHMQKIKMDYRGVLYVGLMITEEGPSVIEFNSRFGDPEAQVFLPLLDGDWSQAFKAVAQGKLPTLKWSDRAAACVVLASPGYPDKPEKGLEIKGSMKPQEDSYVLHAGTKRVGERWLTNGGRVLNLMGIGRDLEAALNHAYTQAQVVSFERMQMRKDIGKKMLKDV
jgi:phosphoribosylamine---glycine ligase